MLIIREMQKSEVGLVDGFPPEDWNLNLSKFLSFHFGQEYFYPIVAEIDGIIAGYANGIYSGNAGWLGNIIVKNEFRRMGIGHELTIHLVNSFNGKGCSTQILTASEMGKNIYCRVGFKFTSEYHFFIEGNNFSDYRKHSFIRKINSVDHSEILKLDKSITDEDRAVLIQRYFSTGWVFADNNSENIRGVFLPDLGTGLIIAKDNDAGIELIKFRLSIGKPSAIIPSENEAAIDFLLSEGYKLSKSLPRMVIGNEVNWKPECVFNRGGGYCG